MAASAQVPSSDVRVNEIMEGSVVVSSTVYFSSPAAVACDTFATEIASNPASIFQTEAFSTYGEIESSEVKIEQEVIYATFPPSAPDVSPSTVLPAVPPPLPAVPSPPLTGIDNAESGNAASGSATSASSTTWLVVGVAGAGVVTVLATAATMWRRKRKPPIRTGLYPYDIRSVLVHENNAIRAGVQADLRRDVLEPEELPENIELQWNPIYDVEAPSSHITSSTEDIRSMTITDNAVYEIDAERGTEEEMMPAAADDDDIVDACTKP
ncbi:hypothetical protein CYMTET_32064 [Cymbomonas tetramitiformis]|uniref:Uncharacterized protein n=1 Tax=Cymbomonas tetramitiformis TaxID=36881 RepID=A0AAE0FGD2_9CHLO|nr:hypothetical protein CYMTET_32064 [Cymbomonas tetramitiformis]